MEKASVALAGADYFGAEKIASKALVQARSRDDFVRMARICLPLQEARRQIRVEAIDAGHIGVLSALPPRASDLVPGMYLVQPPLIGVEARAIRLTAHARRIPIVVVCREPMTRLGKWPVVAVGTGGLVDTITLRVRVDPPADVESCATSATKDVCAAPPPAGWFINALEALGDWVIADLRASDPPAHRVDDCLDALDAIPDHEKLLQRLAEECRGAAIAPVPERPRRRPRLDDLRTI
jgi:hypothetical protein